MTLCTQEIKTPQSWDRRKLKFHLAGFFGGGTPSKENLEYWTDGTVPWVTPKDMKRRKIESAEDYITEEAVNSSATNMVPAGSVLMVVRSGILKHSLPVALTKVPVALNQDMKAFQFLKSMLPLFFAYWTEGQQKEKLLQWGQVGATVDNINIDEMLNSSISVPGLTTQHAIADFLDRETARIDALIEKKQRLVELLEERYEATASILSTGSLVIGGQIYSEIDWLGHIPSSWTVEKVHWHFYAAKGKDAQKYTKEYCGANAGTYPVYSGQTSNEGVMGRIDTYDYDFGEDGVLFATTVGAKAMDLRHLNGKFSLSQNCMIIVPRRKITLKFFMYQMRVLFRKERQLIPDHMQASFRVEDLYRYRIAIPPFDVAEAISAEIEKAESILSRIVRPVNASISRLEEYRSALISAAVTGQIDVTAYGRSGTTERHIDTIEDAASA